MEDIVDRKENCEKVVEIAKALDEMKCLETVVLDVAIQSGWTDYFIITTINSAAHLKGIYKNLQEIFVKLDIEPMRRQKNIDNENWVLIDCSYFVVHLMDKEHREFYDLEKLWFSAERIYQASE